MNRPDEKTSLQVQELIGSLAPSELNVDPAAAYSRYRAKFGNRLNGRIGFFRLPQFNRPLWSAVAGVCALALLLSFAPTRTWGQKILQMLRVQKIAVVPVDLNAIQPLTASGAGQLIAQFLSKNVVVTMKPGSPTQAASTAEASQMAGFSVRTLDALGAPQKIRVQDQAAFHMTLDHDQIQAVLDETGRSDIQIPQSVNGSTVAVYIPKAVVENYGRCSGGKRSCTEFIQAPTPTVSIPPGLNMSALAEAGLQLTGMSASEAHNFSQTIDWSSTLVIPVPTNGGSYQTVSVDGVAGTLVETPSKASWERYTLIWTKNGMVYFLTGVGDAGEALATVASLN